MMNKLEKIKQTKDEYCTQWCLNEIDFIKTNCKTEKPIYILDTWGERSYFLSDNTVYIVKFDHIDETLKFSSLYTVELQTKKLKTIIKDVEEDYTIETFETWYNSPSQINQDVSVSYKNVIEFLQKYNDNTFQYNNYQFYIKRDDDRTWAFYIYAKNLKTNIITKIYVDSFIYEIEPETKHVAIDDLGNEISNYQKLKLRKNFLEYCNTHCKELNTKMFYAMELVKQTVQPVEQHCGWFIRKVFYDDGDINIWVDDFLTYDKKPYFLVGNNLKHITKVAVLDFFKPEYKTTDIYVSGYYKRNCWILNKQEIEKLLEFLNRPFSYKNTIYYKKSRRWYKDLDYTDDDIKTNWQWLISEYNDNTGDVHDKLLPLDLPIPDYTKLLKVQNNERI